MAMPGRARGVQGFQNPVSDRVFRYLLTLEVEKAARLGYCVSLVCLEPDQEPLGADGHLARNLARLALPSLRRTDAAGMIGRDTVGLLLVDAAPSALPVIVDRAVGLLRSPDRERVGPLVSGGGACFPLTASSEPALVRQAWACLRQAREAGGDRLVVAERPGTSVSSSPWAEAQSRGLVASPS
jgi:hypothetical protein